VSERPGIKKWSEDHVLTIEAGDHGLPAHMRDSIYNPSHWIKCIQSEGTSIAVFRKFAAIICRSIKADPVIGFLNAADNHVVTNNDAH